jgi:hypothetical protein
MPRQPIPERIAASDLFEGHVLTSGQAQALSVAPAEGTLLSGTLVVRYGLRLLGKPHVSIVPELVAVDYGRMLNGEAAWEFLTRQSNLFPRAEVFGHRNDGRDDMLLVRALDLALAPEVLVFSGTDAVLPAAKPSALIASQNEREALPKRLLAALPVFDDPDAWKATLS